MGPREWLVVTGWVTCSLTLLFIVMTLSPGLIDIQERWKRGPGYRGHRRALGRQGGPEGPGGPAGHKKNQEAAEGTA